MKIITKIKLIALCVALIGIAFLFIRISNLAEENTRLQNNQSTLLSENNALIAESQKYKTSDSLSAIKVNELRLTLEEYKKYRSDDLALINKLNIDKREMQKVIDLQAKTINDLAAPLRDTVIIYKGSETGVKAFSYRSQWTDVEGLINLQSDSVNLSVRNRESLVIVESVKYKRFLGFLWRTKKIKSRSVDIVSRNPNTEIIDADYESIETLR